MAPGVRDCPQHKACQGGVVGLEFLVHEDPGEEQYKEKDEEEVLALPTSACKTYKMVRRKLKIKPWNPPLAYRCSPNSSWKRNQPLATLIPLREAKDSWPGLRAMMSPSTNKLTGRLTRCPSL
jgi:hypothetical protein